MKKILIFFAAILAFSCKAKRQEANFDDFAFENPDYSGFSHDGIDFDMTQMSATMIFAQVFDMLVDSEKYLGKCFKIRGNFLSSLEENGKRYFACVVPDATACCQQGLSFVPEKGMEYPADFPAENAEMTICGTYEFFDDGEYSFYYLKVREMEF